MSEQNSEGLLKRPKNEYTQFYSLDIDGLSKLLDSDVMHGEKELNMRQEESQRIAESTAKFLAQ